MKRIYILILLFITLSVSAQSKIGGAKENLSGSSQNSSGGGVLIEEKSSSYVSSSSSLSRSLFSDLFGGILLELTLGLAYYVAFETAAEMDSPMHQAALSPYPFHKGTKGDYQYVGDNSVFWRLEGSNYYFSEKGTFYTNDLNIKTRIGNRFAVNVQYLHFWEKLLTTENEKLDLFSATIQYYRVRTPRVSIHWGLGASYLGNQLKQFGFATELGNEIFIKPFSIYSDLKCSFFKNSDVFLFSVGPKYYVRNFNIGVKYQYVNLAGYKSSGISFGVGAMF